MHTKIVNLYQHFSLDPQPGAHAHLSVYVPQGLDFEGLHRRLPAVLILPGGGYGHTSLREAEPVALRFAALGYGAFVLHYSCAPLHFPVQLQEAAMAMRYIRDHGGELGLGEKLAVVGFSAGGHLAGMISLLYDHPEVTHIGPAAVLRPDALGLCYPVTLAWGRTHEGTMDNISGGDPQLRQQLSLEKLVRPDMPPVFLWHTREDTCVPCRNSLLFAAALEEAGVDFAMNIYRTGVHGLSLADETVYRADGVPAFSREVLGWMDSMTAYFRELGFKITDLEK